MRRHNWHTTTTVVPPLLLPPSQIPLLQVVLPLAVVAHLRFRKLNFIEVVN